MTSTIDKHQIERFDEGTLAGLREDFRRARFDDSFVARAEAIAPNLLDQVRLPAVWWWLRWEGTAASVLARLFAYADTVEATAVDEVFSPEIRDALIDGGVLLRDDESGRVSSPVRIMPFEGLWIASDEMDAPGDPVMGPGATTLRLARALRIEPGESLLDVGCGAGTLALLAASRGAVEAVGVDLLERAVAWSRFNARLNGLEATFLAGDLAAPVSGRRFDLVVSQPPFVIQAGDDEGTTYLHGGAKGDEIALRLVSEVFGVLESTGRALVLYDAPRLPDQTVEDRLREALGVEEHRTLAVTAPGHHADVQAIAYSSIRAPALGVDYRDAVFRVRDHLQKLGATDGVHVLADLRPARPGESSLLAVAEAPSLRGWDANALEVARAGLELVTCDDETLLERRIALAPDAWLVQERSLATGATKTRVRFESDRNEAFELSDAASVLVEIVCEEPRIRKIVRELARAAGARPDEMRQQALGFLRQTILSGLFVPLSH